MPRADLSDADLTHADLTEANLTEANLTRAKIADANFTRANLTGAMVNQTLFDSQDALEGAVLDGVDVTRARFGSAPPRVSRPGAAK